MQDSNLHNITSDKVYLRELGESDSLSKIARLISDNAKVLDIGCGSGDLGQFLRMEKSCHVTGLDYSEASLAEAKSKLDEVDLIDLNVTMPSQIVSDKYDAIVFADILEHIMTPEKVLADAKTLLTDNGKIYISIPNAGYIGALLSLYEGEWEYREEGILDSTHVRYYTGKSLINLIERAGLHGRIADRVNKDLTASEFTQRLDALPNSVRNWLMAKPEAATYQFIAEVSDSPLTEPSKPELPLTLQHITKIYTRTENGEFSEDKTVFCHGVMGKKNTLRFTLTEKSIAGIKFMFADRPSVYELYDITIFDGSAPRLHLSELKDMDFEQASSMSDNAFFPMQLLATEEGATVAFSLPEVVTGDALSVEVTLHAPISGNNLTFSPKISETLFNDMIMRQEKAFFEQNAHLLKQVESQFAQIESISKLYQEGLDYQQTLQARIESLESELSHEKAKLESELALTSQKLTNVEQNLASVLNSSSWKITAPLRKINELKSKQ